MRRHDPSEVHKKKMTDIEFVPVTKVGSIPKGEGAAFPVHGKMVAIFFDGETYHAINDFCPHMGASLAEGHFEEGVVVCPWHAWGFKVCDGTWCENPAIKTDAYELRVVGDEIHVAVPPNDDTDITEADSTDR